MKYKLTKKTAIKQLQELSTGDGDAEINHFAADHILLAFLAGEGHKDLVEAWKEAERRCGFLYA